MRVIGLTGGIACGKSTVSHWLQEQPGCRILDGDLLSRELTAHPDGAALPLIRNTFGEAVFSSDGSLNRRALGRVVFSDSRAREVLDRLMAPLLQELTLRRLQEAREDGVELCFLDYPLLLEKGYDTLCDTVWCVYIPARIQLKRLMDRDHLSEEEARSRMDAVLSSEEKAARSQVVIDNSGPLAFTLSTLPALLQAERDAAGAAVRRRRRSGRADLLPEDSVPEDSSVPGHPEVSSPFPEASGPSVSRSGSPAGAPAAPGFPTVMDRPAAARRKRQPQKAGWKTPSWLIITLSAAAILVSVCFTAQALMRAYLTRQAEQHLSEEHAILRNFPLEYRDLIEASASDFNLNPAFVAAIVRNESSFQPMAESNVGARGLMQLMPDTSEWIAHKLKISGFAFERMYDPASNLQFGCWYLQFLSTLFRGDPVCVACAYHAGQGQVITWLSDPSLSRDGVSLSLESLSDGPTKSYAGRVIKAYGIYQALYFADSDAGNNPVPDHGTGIRQ